MQVSRWKRPFYKMAAGLVAGTRKYWRKWSYAGRISVWQSKLHPFLNPNQAVEQYLTAKLAMLLMVFCAALAVAFVCLLLPGEPHFLKNGLRLERNAYGDGTASRELMVRIGDGTEEPYVVDVQQQAYTVEEVEELFASKEQELERTVLGENISADAVTGNLTFPDTLPGTALALEWSMNRYDLVDYEGTLKADALTEEGELLTITAMLPYEDLELTHTFTVRVCLPKLTQEEQLRNSLEKEIRRIDENTRSEDSLLLPEEVNGTAVHYREEPESFAGVCLLPAILLTGIAIGRDLDLKKEVEARDRQMQYDYPDVVHKLLMLLKAGMTARGAFFKIADEYVQSRSRQKRQRYVYDEILLTCRNMQSGMSEQEAYERFGNQCGLQIYLRFSTLLIQNLKKGNRDLSRQLELEVTEAQEQRREAVRAQGAKVEMKLLLPMLLMLAVILIVLIVPAFMTMQG